MLEVDIRSSPVQSSQPDNLCVPALQASDQLREQGVMAAEGLHFHLGVHVNHDRGLYTAGLSSVSNISPMC